MTRNGSVGTRGQRVQIGVAVLVSCLLWQASSSTGFAADNQVSMSGQLSSLFSEVTGGDAGRYREDRQVRDGFSGGLDWLTLDAEQSPWRYTSEMRARNEVDLEWSNRLERDEWGYLTQEASVYPHYYDASNRFYDNAPRLYDLDTTLRTLRGDVSLEAGTDIEGLPRTFLGYRHQARDGETNSYWGSWLRDTPPANESILFVLPIQRVRDERTNTLYFGAAHELAGWNLTAREDITRFEGTDTYDETGFYENGVHVFTRKYRNTPRHTTWATSLGSARELADGRLRIALDWRHATTHSDSTTDADAFTPAGARHYGEHSLNYNVAEQAGRLYSQESGLRLDYSPLDWMRIWTGGKFLTGKRVGTSMRGEEGAEGAAVDNNTATVDEFWASKTINREIGWTEETGIEFTMVPKTRVAFEMTLDQSRTKYDWNADVTGSANTGNQGDWLWLSTIWENRNMFTSSVRNWSLPWMTVWTRYRYRVDAADVQDQVDQANTKPGDPEYESSISGASYYPGRIEDTKRGTHELLISPSLKLGPRWTVNPRFEHRTSTYHVSGDPEPEISSFRSNTAAVGVLAQPIDDLTCALNLSRQFALTWTRAKSFTNSLQIDPGTGAVNTGYYGGLTPEFNASYTAVDSRVEYRWNELTWSITGGVVEGNGDFDTTLASGGIGLRGPIGRLDGATWQTLYQFYDYYENDNGGINDYTAHGIFFLVKMPFEFSLASGGQ